MWSSAESLTWRRLALVGGLLLGAAGGGAVGASTTPSSSPPEGDLAADVDWEALESAAAEDGALTWYTSIPEEPARAILDDFAEAYPDLDVTLVSRGQGPLTETFLADFSRGDVKADVVTVSTVLDLQNIVDVGATEAFVPAGVELLRDDIRGAEPDGLGVYLSVYTWAWRTDLPEELQSRFAAGDWAMFEDPDVVEALRGRVVSGDPALAGAPFMGHLGLRAAWGEEQYFDWVGGPFRALEPTLYESNVPAAEALVTGEADAALITHSFAVGQIAAGAPIRTAFFDPTPAYATMSTLAADAPHRAAGELFLTWLVNEPGQAAIVANYNAQSGLENWQDTRPFTESDWYAPEEHDPTRLGVLAPDEAAIDRDDFLDAFAAAFRG